MRDQPVDLNRNVNRPGHWTRCALAGVLFLAPSVAALATEGPESQPSSAAAADAAKPAEVRRFRAEEVYDSESVIRFHSDFHSGQFDKLKISEDDRYGITAATPERLAIVEAPGQQPGQRAAKFVVPRESGSFRSEIALPHEDGFQDRWYSARILIPEDWTDAPDDGSDIVMQWHAIPGNWRATYPNMSLNVDGTRWKLRRSFGAAQTGPDRDSAELAPVAKGVWTHWVFHVRWSPGADGVVRAWKDGRLVLERPGPNVYSTIGVAYTPYLKTGIYHPAWKSIPSQAVSGPQSVASRRVVYVTDMAVADERASMETFRSSAYSTPPHNSAAPSEQ